MNEPRYLLHKADHPIIQSMLIVSNHSVFNVLFLWGSSTYNPQINNGGQDSLTIKHFSSAIFLIQENKPAEGTKDCTKLYKKNDSSSFLAKKKNCYMISFIICVLKWLPPTASVVGNVMIETKPFFMAEVSDFPPCNHSMLIVSNHCFINVLVPRFHFFCLTLCNLAVFRSFE